MRIDGKNRLVLVSATFKSIDFYSLSGEKKFLKIVFTQPEIRLHPHHPDLLAIHRNLVLDPSFLLILIEVKDDQPALIQALGFQITGQLFQAPLMGFFTEKKLISI